MTLPVLVWLLSFCRRFFQAACEVPELQDKFNVDEYSDLVTLTKPVIYISIGEIINTHTVSLQGIGQIYTLHRGSGIWPL